MWQKQQQIKRIVNRVHMTFDWECLWILLCLPSRIAFYVAHVYLLNVMALHQMVGLALRMLLQLMNFLRRSIRRHQLSRDQQIAYGPLLNMLCTVINYLMLVILHVLKILWVHIYFLRDVSTQLRD